MTLGQGLSWSISDLYQVISSPTWSENTLKLMRLNWKYFLVVVAEFVVWSISPSIFGGSACKTLSWVFTQWIILLKHLYWIPRLVAMYKLQWVISQVLCFVLEPGEAKPRSGTLYYGGYSSFFRDFKKNLDFDKTRTNMLFIWF